VTTRFGAFVLDSDLRQLTREGGEIHLTPKAFDLLMLLVAEAGRVVRKTELHQRLWPRTFVSDATLVSLVKELRRALDDRDSRAPIIRTAHGVGYAFIAPIERHAPQRSEVSRWIIAGSRRIPLYTGDNLIGRDPGSAVCLDVAGVARLHARIVVREQGALLEDLGSEHGTSVDKVPVTGQVPLHDGDQLHVGPMVIVYHESATRRGGQHLAAARPSIAVLPFADMSPQHDQEYFCEGIAEELIHALAAIDGLQVSARSSSFQFGGKALNIREVGARLKVDTVLEGSIRKAGNRLRVTAQLVNVSDGYHLWSEQYDRNLDDVFAVQHEIARAIVAKLLVTLHTEPVWPWVKRHTDDLEAYSLYLQGRYHWSRRAVGFLSRAMACFEQAIARDASYALAHAGLADAYTTLGLYGGLPPRAAWSKAKPAAQQAVLLNDELGEAHQAMACIHLFFDWDFVAAEREFRRAIALNPSAGFTHAMFGYLLGTLGRFEEAIAEATRGRALEPMSPLIGYFVAGTLGYARRCDDGLAECRRALDLDPSFALACWAQSLILTGLGRHDAAIDSVERALTLSPDFFPGAACWVYAAAGQHEKSAAILAELRARSRRILPLTFVWLATVAGETDQAFEWLERAYEDRSPMLPAIGVAPVYDPLRGDPRFGALLKKVGLDGVVPARS
jgi:TolB-like protein/DNA-binding winged helix-turn-helix (wHTH) protein